MRPDDTRKAASLKMRRRPTTGRRPPSPNTPSWGRSTNRRLRTGDAFMGLPRGLGVSQLHPLPSPADRPWSVLASLPSSDLDVSGARRAHPGLPQGERVPEAGMIAAGGPSISRGGGARHRLRVHPHCMALQQGSRAAGQRQQSRVLLSQRAGNTPCRNSPSEPGNLFLFFCGLLHRAGSQVTPPHRRARMGQVSSTQTAGRNCKHRKQGLALLRQPARPRWDGSGRSGGRRGCEAEQGPRALKLSLGPHAAVPILVLGRSEYWVATQTTESRR